MSALSRPWRARWSALTVATVLSACSPGDALDAVGLLRDLQAGSVHQTSIPERRTVAWPHAGETIEADLYLRAAPRAALVLAPGLGREGRRDPRLVGLARALADRHFVVMVPDVPRFQAQRIAASDGALLADAVRFLLSRPEGKGPMGIAAVSYGVGPAFLAALAPDLAARVNFIFALGGYYDTESVVTFFTTGCFRENGSDPWRRGQPNEYGKWVFVQANAERLNSAYDRVALSAMAGRKLADLSADIADLMIGLGREGQAVVDLLANTDPARVPALIAALPASVRDDLQRLSLANRDLSALKAKVFLVHGRDDAIVPYTESVALARALPSGVAHLALLDSLAHVDLGPGGIVDAFRLWWVAYGLLQVRR